MGQVPAVGGGARWTALLVYGGIGASDFLDGYLARRWGTASGLGSVLDAAADRLALLAPLFLFALAAPAAFPHVPLWLPVGLVVADAVPGAVWLALRARGRRPRVRHALAGRVSMALSFGLVLWITAGLPEGAVPVLGAAVLLLAGAASAAHVRRWLSTVDHSPPSL